MAEETLAWRTITRGMTVLASDGSTIGTVNRVLGDDNADIFHGVAVRRGGLLSSEEHEVLAGQITMIDEQSLRTNIAPDQVEGLPAPP